MESIVVLLTLFCLCQGQSHGCPKGWTRSNDRCYYISANYDTFDGANKYCKDRKSHLDPDLSCETHMNLVEVLTAHRAKCPTGQNCDQFWIGIKNINSASWSTGNGLLIERKRSCQQWSPGFPRGDRTCGFVSLRNSWNRVFWKDANCASSFKYVCITCPDNFDYIPHINECFYLNLKPATWNDAQKICSKMKKGARLMSILDSTKQKAVVDYIDVQLKRENETHVCYNIMVEQQGRIMWLGGQTRIPNVCDTPFVWKQLGAPDTPFTYMNWWPGSPKCGRIVENCLLITPVYYSNYRWGNADCKVPLCSLCEF